MELRYPCPVCLGVQMTKYTIAHEPPSTVDVCSRCGGVWFYKGEVRRLQKVGLQKAATKIKLAHKSIKMRCHSCFALMDRDDPKCRICNWQNLIDCPVCGEPMKRTRYNHLTLDVCEICNGVWFDQHEHAEIWNPSIWNVGKPRGRIGKKDIPEEGAHLALEALCYLPDFSSVGTGAVAEAGAALLEGSGELLSAVPEVAGVAVEAAGEVAESVVEAIVEIILESIL